MKRNSLGTIEERPTLSALSRLAKRMRDSSRRETALELALKVGRYDGEGSRAIRRVEKAQSDASVAANS